MNKLVKTILTFTAWFAISYLIVGYVTNALFVEVHWIEGATVWDKFREYYIRNFPSNIIPALIMSIIAVSIVIYRNRKNA